LNKRGRGIFSPFLGIEKITMFSLKTQYYIDLITILTQKEIKVRYKNSFFGYLWSIANPLAFAAVFYFVFGIVMKFPMKNPVIFLITALFPWQAFSNSILMGASVFLQNSQLIKKVSFPRFFLLIATLLNDAFHFLMSLPVIVFFLYIYNLLTPQLLMAIVYVPCNLLAQFLITFAIALAVGSLNLFFRDLERLMAILLNLLFYFTPILYPIEMVPEKYRGFVGMNPLSLIMTNWRSIWMDATLDWKAWGISMLTGIILLILSYWVYLKLNKKFSEVI
jgi:lipopolysaccharide transport system permease protein